MSCFSSRIPSTMPQYILPLCLLSLLSAVTDSPCFWWPWLFWGSLVIFSDVTSWNLSNVFLKKRLELRIWGRKTTEVKCASLHIISRVHTMNMTSDCWWRLQSPGFSTEKKKSFNLPTYLFTFSMALYSFSVSSLLLSDLVNFYIFKYYMFLVLELLVGSFSVVPIFLLLFHNLFNYYVDLFL